MNKLKVLLIYVFFLSLFAMESCSSYMAYDFRYKERAKDDYAIIRKNSSVIICGIDEYVPKYGGVKYGRLFGGPDDHSFDILKISSGRHVFLLRYKGLESTSQSWQLSGPNHPLGGWKITSNYKVNDDVKSYVFDIEMGMEYMVVSRDCGVTYELEKIK